MINRTQTLLHNLTEQLYFIDLETDNLVHKSEKALEICIESINKLKKLISKYNFKSQQEEILFFKEIKPQFNSKRIYYNTIYKIETKKLYGGIRIVKKYYNNKRPHLSLKMKNPETIHKKSGKINIFRIAILM